MGRLVSPYFVLRVSREHIVTDTLTQLLLIADGDLKKPLKVLILSSMCCLYSLSHFLLIPLFISLLSSIFCLSYLSHLCFTFPFSLFTFHFSLFTFYSSLFFYFFCHFYFNFLITFFVILFCITLPDLFPCTLFFVDFLSVRLYSMTRKGWMQEVYGKNTFKYVTPFSSFLNIT